MCAISSLTSTFAISSPDEFLYRHSRRVLVTNRLLPSCGHRPTSDVKTTRSVREIANLPSISPERSMSWNSWWMNGRCWSTSTCLQTLIRRRTTDGWRNALARRCSSAIDCRTCTTNVSPVYPRRWRNGNAWLPAGRRFHYRGPYGLCP